MTSLIFGAINFVVILSIGRYVYLRWFKPQIIDAIASQEQHQQNLNSELSGLENKIKEISLDLVLQQQQANDLLQKVQDWNAAHFAALRTQNAQVKVLQIQIDTKNRLKSQNLAFDLAQKKILKIMLPKVGQGLVAHFENPSVASQFLQQICDKLD